MNNIILTKNKKEVINYTLKNKIMLAEDSIYIYINDNKILRIYRYIIDEILKEKISKSLNISTDLIKLNYDYKQFLIQNKNAIQLYDLYLNKIN